jgi:hypothetical protein
MRLFTWSIILVLPENEIRIRDKLWRVLASLSIKHLPGAKASLRAETTAS